MVKMEVYDMTIYFSLPSFLFLSLFSFFLSFSLLLVRLRAAGKRRCAYSDFPGQPFSCAYFKQSR